jgi:hypothetical protein
MLNEGLISLMASGISKVNLALKKTGALTEQRSYHLQIAFQEIIEYAHYDAAKCVFRMARGVGGERIVFGEWGPGIVCAPRCRLAENRVCDTYSLKRTRRIGIIWKFAASKVEIMPRSRAIQRTQGDRLWIELGKPF